MEPILEVRDLTVHFPVFKGFIQRLFGGADAKVHAVDNVSFSIAPGEILGLVGESGCGKSTIARTLVGLTSATGGTIVYKGRDITRPKPKERKVLHEQIQIVFQDPHAALNPAITIGEAIADVLRTHGIPSPDGTRAPVTSQTPLRPVVNQVLEDVGLHPADLFHDKYPRELSGGQKQRVVLGRVIALRPSIVIADEPVAMLDMSIRAHVLRLLLDLRAKYGLTYIFITHDLATAKLICERIAIMYLGQIAEIGTTRSVYAHPKHPYTKALLEAIPVPDPDRRHEKKLPKGEVPNAVNPPAGCRFHPRCPVATPTCGWEPRDVFELLDRRALDVETRNRDEEALGPRESITTDGQTLRIRAGKTGLPRTQKWLMALFVLVAGTAEGAFVAAVGIAVLLSGFLTLLMTDRLARRDPFEIRQLASKTERVRAYLGEVLTTAPEPMARAVGQLATADGVAFVEYSPTSDPGLRKVQETEVRCVLY